jgi:cytoskeletal protein RodZ
MDQDRLTKGELLRIQRRRRNETQAEAAATLQIPLSAYKDLEADRECAWELTQLPNIRLRDYELCFLARRRQGWNLDELAAKSGLTKWYLSQIERGKAPSATLLRFWAER